MKLEAVEGSGVLMTSCVNPSYGHVWTRGPDGSSTIDGLMGGMEKGYVEGSVADVFDIGGGMTLKSF